jgi:hypothetical protein
MENNYHTPWQNFACDNFVFQNVTDTSPVFHFVTISVSQHVHPWILIIIL